MPRSLLAGAGATTLVAVALPLGAADVVGVPITCSKGGADTLRLAPVLPATVAPGTTFTVRLDGVDTRIKWQLGLNHLRAMTWDFGLPAGAKLVDGSLRIVPETGSANLRPGASVSARGNVVTLSAPAKLESPDGYRFPSVEMKLETTASAGSTLAWTFRHYEVTANALLLGDLLVTCDPTPRPYTVATTRVVAAE